MVNYQTANYKLVLFVGEVGALETKTFFRDIDLHVFSVDSVYVNDNFLLPLTEIIVILFLKRCATLE